MLGNFLWRERGVGLDGDENQWHLMDGSSSSSRSHGAVRVEEGRLGGMNDMLDVGACRGRGGVVVVGQVVLEGGESRREFIEASSVGDGVVVLFLDGEERGQPGVTLGTVAEDSLLSLTRGAAGGESSKHGDGQLRR